MGDKSFVFVLIAFLLPLSAFSGTLVDDFNDGNLDGWRMYESWWHDRNVIPNSGIWVVEEGQAVGGDDNSWRLYGLYTGDMSWSNYTTEISIKLSKRLLECSVNTGVWVYTRFQMNEGKLGLNCYAVGMCNDNGFSAKGGYKYVGGDFQNIQERFIDSKANVWYRFRMTVDGDHITGFIDDEKVFDLTDSSFPSGSVAIAVNGMKAMFDDFMVTGPEIPDNQLGRPVEASGKLATTWANLKISAKE